ncbi:hypothetical protein K450DRAFT_261266 [Umbelopsis ramanniana AG]|uniref:Striatin N-terminal domain-containing protein n=1 Tax=Umbelopsis ramanniana AG TaxID=1314678 RepID=A0AAD5HAJ2_UMBRA|nr:uncharacterized protein K450DRAFT_261266 [Umbelopsis ramanniana AG]KAI8575566.1 hypothetical protein K450DRAFT_261266 [Umbelopsis ramanniana AG]
MMQQTPQSSQQRLLNGRDNVMKDANIPSNFSLAIQSPEYTLPGVLHFLQQEWRRFERERNEWEIEKAEYKARIALLEGERRGFANLKLDLMKRVKMLEYALRQERKKYMNNPKARTIQQQEEFTRTVDSPNPPSSPNLSSLRDSQDASVKLESQDKLPAAFVASQIDDKAKTRSRELLKSCLKEINQLALSTSKLPYTTAFTSGLQNQYSKITSQASQDVQHDTESISTLKDPSEENKAAARRQTPKQPDDSMSTFIPQHNTSLLQDGKIESGQQQKVDKDNDIPSTISDVEVPDNVDEVAMINNVINIAKERKQRDQSNPGSGSRKGLSEEEQLTKDVQEKYSLSADKVRKLLKNAERLIHQENNIPMSSKDSLLGKVDNLKLPSEAEVEVEDADSESRPKMWRAKHNLRGHLDCVRSVSFHANELLIASGSDDGTIKIWDLKNSIVKDSVMQKKSSHEEMDPIITYRGHTMGVTKVEISAEQGRLYSSSLDSTIRVWQLPPADKSPYSPYDSALNIAPYIGHTDAIWDFKLFPTAIADYLPLASASADGTVKIWDTSASGNLLKSSWSYNGVIDEHQDEQRNLPVPTSLDICHTNLRQLAVAYRNTEVKVFDVETGQIVLTIPADPSADNSCLTQINKIVSHPTLPLLITGHENKLIKFYDINTGNSVFTMSAHLDGVTALDIDPSGITLVSGGHDGSIRLWDISSTSRSCVQEYTAHRRKADEGVLSVQFHKELPWLVSGGADGIVKAYHHSI